MLLIPAISANMKNKHTSDEKHKKHTTFLYCKRVNIVKFYTIKLFKNIKYLIYILFKLLVNN